MNIPEELKLNKFQLVRIPKKCEYFKMMSTNGTAFQDKGIYGDASAEKAQRKVDELMNGMEMFDKLRAEEESKK